MLICPAPLRTNAVGVVNEIEKPAATFSRKVAAGFEIFLRVYLFTSPRDAHKLSRSRSPKRGSGT
jgi:hypothetical protein